PITGKQLTRTMDLPAQGSSAVAARAVALSAAELVITSWMELTMSPRAERAPDQAPSSPSASEELRRAAQDRALRRAGREGGAALRATFTLRRGRTSLDLGAGARFGLARLSGTPADATRTRGGTLAGTWAGPIAYAGVGIHAAPVLIEAGVEAGQVLRSVDGL